MLSELLEKLAQGLDARDVPYTVIGGQAVIARYQVSWLHPG